MTTISTAELEKFDQIIKIQNNPQKLFVSLEKGAKQPIWATKNSAACDLFVLGDYVLPPNSHTLLSTGVRFEIPNGKFGLVKSRSSMAKKGIMVDGVIDSDYRGIVYLNTHNQTNKEFCVKSGTRLAQMLILNHDQPKIVVKEKLSQTERGNGGFGSTGKF